MGSAWLYVLVALIAALTVSLVDAQTQAPSDTTAPPATVPSTNVPDNSTTEPPSEGGRSNHWKPVAGIAIGFSGGFLIFGVVLIAVLAYMRPQN